MLPKELYDAAATRELDRIAITEGGITGLTLMERAGLALWEQIRDRWPTALHVVVVAGPGNNGGDGHSVARLAKEQGRRVTVVSIGDASHRRGDAALAFDAAVAAGVSYSTDLHQALAAADLVVDALLGTGLSHPVTGDYHTAITAINATSVPVISADLPSGLHADTGQALGCAVFAEVTVTFIALKQGLFTAAGPDHAGEVIFAPLGVPPEIFAAVGPTALRLDLARLPVLLPPRRRSGHKGHHGHVLVVGGSLGFGGAGCLAAEAALRAGAGLVSMVTHPGHQWLPAGPEIMCHMVTELAAIDHLLNQADTVVLGPGLGDGEWGRRIFGHCMAYEREVPMVVDADALNHLSGVALRRREWVLTPHPGEAARLLGISTAEIQADRFAAVRALSGRYGGTVVLKGNGTLVHDDAHPVGLCAAGNPGMGTAGMGDVLSGIIAALWGQGLSAANAARVGVTVHAQAGDKAARAGGERGMIASDLFPHIRRLLNPP